MFSDTSSIKIKKDLYKKIEVASKMIGASSVTEFASQILETEAEKIITKGAKGEATQAEIDDIASKLQGLGYLE